MVQGSTGYSGTQKLFLKKYIFTQLSHIKTKNPVSWYMYTMNLVSSQIAVNGIQL